MESKTNEDALKDKDYLIFKSNFNQFYGRITEEDNLVVIDTGGWSDNEDAVEELSKCVWWLKYFQIEQRGGHYYCNTNPRAGKYRWNIKKQRVL